MQKYLLILFGIGVLIAYYFDFKKNEAVGKDKSRSFLYLFVIIVIVLLTIKGLLL